jgi:filamentous hemagglutinin
MNRMSTTTALALILSSAAATSGWSGARGQGVSVSSAPPVVAGDSRTRVDVTSGGTPIVSIATPRSDGTSYNVFSKLNVGKEGLIFNNSKEIGRSQIGGQILANSRLKNSGEASLILNEVTGGTRSDLRGALEVFGGRASLVIANPSGITCDGCGFINVARASLATGKITFGADGAFSGFAVDGGDVRVEGQGLLAGNVDFFDIVTGSAIINANLFARDLVISGGAADFDFASRSATARGTGNDRLAIDSSLLGGMYANRIRLIGTGKGVGINLQGLVNALEGPLAISADGAITVKSAAAASDVTIASKANINIDERVYGGGATRIDAVGNIVLAGDFVGAANSVSLKSGGDIRLGGAGLYAGLSSAGRFDQAGTLTISAAGDVTASGVRAIASEGLSLSARSAALGKETVFSARDINVQIGKRLISDASIEATGNLALSGDALTLGGDLIANGSLAIDGRNVLLSGRNIGLARLTVAARDALGITAEGDLQSAGVAKLSAKVIDNAGRVLGMGGAVVEATDALTNSGSLLSGGDATVTSGGDADLSGTVNANGSTRVSARGTANVTGTVAAAGDVALDAAGLALEGALSSGANLSATTSGALTAGAASVLVGNGAIALSAGSLDASGTISSGGTLDLTIADALSLAGQTNAGGALSAKASQIALGGTTVSDGGISLTSSGTLNATGAVSAAGALNAQAASITNAKGAQLVAGAALSLTATADLTNAGAISGKSANLSSGAALTNSGTLYGADAANISAKTTLTQSGTAESGKAISLAADAITLSGKTLGMEGVRATAKTIATSGDLQSGGTLALDARETLTTAGSILAVGDLSAKSGAGFVQAANITLGRNAKLAAVGSFTQNGTIQAAGTIDLSGSRVSGSGALASDASIAVRALGFGIDLTGDISGKAGLLFATSDALSLGNVTTEGLIDIAATDLNVAGDVVASSGFLTQITGSLALTKTGKLRSGTGLALDVTTLTNAGLIESAGALSLKTRETLTNTGALTSADALTLNIGRDLSGAGSLQAGTALRATVAGSAALDGTLTAAGDLSLSAKSLAVNATLATAGRLDLTATDALTISADALVSAQKDAVLGATSLTNDGAITANAALSLSATDALTNTGALQSGSLENAADLNITGGSIDVRGVAASSGATRLTSAGDISVAGQINSVGALALDGARARVDGSLQSNRNAAILARIGSVVIGGSVLAAQDLSLTAATALEVNGSVKADQALVLKGRSTSVSGSAIGVEALSINAAEDFTSSNRVATNGALQVVAGTIALGGTVDAGGGVDIAARDTLALTGTLFGSKALNISANALDLTGTIQSLGALSVTTRDRTDIASEARLLSGDTLLLNGGRSISALGTVASKASGTLNASDSITTTGRLDSGAALRFAAQTLSLGGSIASDTSVSATATGTLTLDGSLSAKGAVALEAANLSLSGSLLTKDSARLSATGALDLNGTVSGDTGVDLSAADLNIAGQIISKTGLAAKASNIIVGADGDLQSDGALALDAAQALTLDGSLLTLDALTLSGTTSLDIGGTLQSSANTTLSTGGTLTSRGTITAKGDISARAANAALGGVSSSGGTLTVNAAQASVTGRLAAKTAIAVNATSSAALALGSSLESDGSTVIKGADISARGSVRSGTTALVDATTTLEQSGRLEAREGVTFTALGSLSNSGTVITLGTISVRGGATDLDGDIKGNTLTLNADTLRVRGKLSAGTVLDLIAANTLTTEATAALASGAAFGISAGTTATLGGTLEASGALTLSAGDTLTLAGSAKSKTDAQISAAKIRLDGSVSADKTLSVDAADALTLAGSLSGVEGLTARGNSVDVGGAARLRTDQALSLTSANRLTNSGDISALGNASITAGTALENDGIIKASTLNLEGGSISLGGASTLGATTALSLGSRESLRTLGTIDSDGTLTLSARTTLDQSADLRAAGAATLTADGAFTGSGSINSADRLTLNAASLASSGAITADHGVNLTTTSGDIALGGGLASATGITLKSAGDIALLSTANTNGTLSLEGRDISLSALTIGRGAVAITAARAVTLFDDATLSSNNQIGIAGATLTNDGVISAKNGVNATLSGSLTNTKDILTEGALTLKGADISSSGTLKAGKALSIDASGTVSLGGSTSADTTLDVTSAQLNTSGAVSAVGALSLDSSGDITLGRTSSLITQSNLALTSAGALSLGGTSFSSGTTRLSGATSLTLANDVQSVGDVTLEGAALSLGGTLTTDAALSATTLGTANLTGTYSAAKGISLISGATDFAAGSRLISGDALSVNAASLGNAGTLSATKALTLTSSADLATSGTVSADEALSLSANGALTQTGTVDSGALLSLSGSRITLANRASGITGISVQGGSIALTGAAQLSAGSDDPTAATIATIALTSAGALNTAGLIDATGSVALSAATLNQAAQIISGGEVSVQANAGTLTNSGNIGAASKVTLAGSSLTNRAAIVSEQSVSLTNRAGTAALGAIISGKTGVALTSSGDVLISGTLVSKDRLDANITGALTTTRTGELLADKNLTLSATTALSNEGRISSLEALAFTTPTFSSTGSLESGKAFALSADSITLAGRVTSTDAISLTATNGALDLGAKLEGTDITLASLGGDLTVRSGIAIDATGTARLTSNRNISVGGLVTGDAGVTVNTTGGSISFERGAQSATAGVTVSASRAVTNAGTLTAKTDVNVSGSSITSGRVAADSAVTLDASGALTVTDIIDAGTSVNLTSTAGAVNVDTLGAVLSGGAITLSAATDINNAGEVSAATTLDATATGTLTNNASGFIFSKRGATRLSGTRLSLGGDVYSATTLALTSNDIVISGSVGANNSFGVRTNTLSILSDGLLQSNGALTLTLGTAQIDGTLRARDTLDLSAATLNLGTEGVVGAVGRLNANVQGTLDNRGTIKVATKIGAPGTNDTLGALTLGAGTLNNSNLISATGTLTSSGGALTNSGIIKSGADLGITNSTTTLTDTASLEALGALSVGSNSITSAGTITANGALALNGTNALSSSGALISNTSSITLTSDGTATITGSVDAKTSVRLTSGQIQLSGDVVAGDTSTGGNVALTATRGALNIASNITSNNGTVLLSAEAGRLSIAAQATLYALRGLSATADTIDAAGKLSAKGGVNLTAQNALTLSGSLISNSAVRLGAGTALTLERSSTVDGSSATLSAANLTARGVIDTSDGIDITARTAASIEGRISTGGTISFGSANTADLSITSSGSLISDFASISLQNIGNLSVANGGVIAARAADVSASFTGTANILGRIEAGTDVRLTNRGSSALTIAQGGVLAAGSDIIISGGTLSVAGLAAAGRDFSFTTTGFDGSFNSLSVDGEVSAGRNLNIEAAGGLRLSSTGKISAGDIDKAAIGNAQINAGFANIAGTISANGTLTLNTSGAGGAPADDFILSGALQSTGALSLTAARAARIENGSRIISNSSVTLSGQSITALGTIGAGDLVSLTSTGNILHGGLIQSGRRVAVNAGGTITLQDDSRIETTSNAATIGFARDAGGLANIDVRAGGAISASGILFSDGAVALKSASANISNLGTITGTRDVVLQADSGSVTNSGNITGNNLALYQGVDFFNTGSFTATGNLLLSAPNITNSGTNALLGSGGSLILITPGNLTNQNGGTLFAGDEIAAQAGGGITNDLSTILALRDISLSAPNLLNTSARIESLSGSITIEAQNVVNQIKNLSITRGGPASPSGLYDNNGQIFSQAGNFDITTCEGSSRFLYRCSGNSVEVRISTNGIIIGTFTYRPATAGGDDTVTTNSGASTIIASGDVTITTGSKSIGSVTNSNSSILAGNNISITAGTLNNVATLLTRTRTEDVIERQVRNGFEDSGSCPPEAIAGTCMILPPPAVGARYKFFVDVVVDKRIITEQVPLPTLINAGGTVFLNVGNLNNDNQPALNGQTILRGADTRPPVNTTGAGAQGGRGNFIDPNAARDGVTAIGGVTDTASGGQSARANGITVAVNGGDTLTNTGGTGNGAGTIGTATQAMIGAGGAALDADAASGALNPTLTGANTANQRNASVGVTLADGSAATGSAAGANGGGANGAGATNLTGPANIIIGTTNSGGGAGVGTGTFTPGGFINSLINRIIGGGANQAGGAVTLDTSVATTVTAVKTAGITGVDGVDPNATASADLTAMAAQNARLLGGFGGLAIPDILGADGQAGGFVLDFLRSFGLTTGAGGFGIAGGGGLFTFNNNPDSQFLFTTNPGFASTAALFDSNFFFDQLGIDRSTRFTRLGDGFFEAQLIGKQVQAATGQAKLGAFGDAFAQARGLLEAGVAEAKRLSLSIGVALTAAQVASLKTSLVWYVKSTVQGREVLVPVVYLAAADQKSIKNGAIISGTNVVANVAGTLTNNGTISASRVVSLTAGGDIVNQAGGRISGGTVIASAARDILASGGSSISAGVRSGENASAGGGNILLSAGRDISLSATTNTSSISQRTDRGKKGFTQGSSTTQTATGAELAATGNLVVSAGRDLTLSAAKVSAGGDASLFAGRDVTITGVTTTDTSNTLTSRGKKGSTSASSAAQTFNGTSITTGGTLSVSAGVPDGRTPAGATTGTLTIKGSDINAGGDAALRATTIDISNATEAQSDKSKTVSVKTGFLSKRTTTTKSATSSETALASTITTGGNLTVAATDTLTITGSDIIATGNATLTGTNGVQLSSALETATAKDSSKSKRRSSSVAETATTNRLARITAGGNLGVGAVNADGTASGNVTIAGADLSAGVRSGENASAGGTTTLVGQNVTITGVIDTATLDATSRTVKKGLLSKKVTTTTQSSSTEAVVASTIAGDRVNVIATGGDVNIKGSNVVSDNGTLVQATGNVTITTREAKSSESQSVKVKKSGISLSGAGLFAGVAKNTQANTLDTTTNTGSLVGSANGDVTVNAGKALTITGSQVAAPDTVNLIGESVKIENATDTANSTSSSRSSSFGVSLKVNSPLIAGVQAANALARLAATASDTRTQAVAGVAAGLAVANTVDAAKDVVDALGGVKTLAGGLSKLGALGSLNVSLGISKSRSSSASSDQTVVGATVAGGDVNIIARGAGTASTPSTGSGQGIAVTGSSVTAVRDLTLSAPGSITFNAAQALDTSTAKNRSSGFDIGVSISAKDVTNIENVLSAGGTPASAGAGLRVVTPGALRRKRLRWEYAGSAA